jgi:hypothetical protein
MRIALALLPVVLAACAGPAVTEGAGSSIPAPQAAAQTCAGLGLTPQSPAFERCVAAEGHRENSGTRGLVGTLYRDVTMGPPL